MRAAAVEASDGCVGALDAAWACFAGMAVGGVVFRAVSASWCFLGAEFLSVPIFEAVSALGVFSDIKEGFEGAAAVKKE